MWTFYLWLLLLFGFLAAVLLTIQTPLVAGPCIFPELRDWNGSWCCANFNHMDCNHKLRIYSKPEKTNGSVQEREGAANLGFSVPLCYMYMLMNCRWAIRLNACFNNRDLCVHKSEIVVAAKSLTALLSCSICKRACKPHLEGKHPSGQNTFLVSSLQS